MPVRYHGSVWLRGRITRNLMPPGRALKMARETTVFELTKNEREMNTRLLPIQRCPGLLQR